MHHPKQMVGSSGSCSSKRGHSCSTSDECPCGPVSKRPAMHHGGEGGEETLADSLFSLVNAAEQLQRQAQERSGDAFNNAHRNPLACSAPPALSARPNVFPPAERLITFTTASREYPHLRPVPLQELASLKLFRSWVRRSFELKDDCYFVLVDRSMEAKNSEDESGLIDSDMKLLRAKDIEIVEVPQEEAERAQEKEQDTLSPTTNNTNNSVAPVQNHQELLLYAKSILVFLSEKGNMEARNIITSCPSSFVSCTPLASMPSDPHSYHSLHNSTGALVPAAAPAVAPPALPRIVAQAPPCLIPGYYIFSPVFDSYGEKRKLPIKIEIPRALVFNGERYKTVSTYIGLGPFGNDPNSFVKLEGDHLVGTVASRLEDDEEGNTTSASNGGAAMCTYVFKNLRLKTRSLIRTVLDVAYNGMRTGRFFFMVDNEVLPNTSRRFEIKAPSGYTIKMVNKTARSNPVAKHAQSTPPPSQPSSPLSLPSSPPLPDSPHPLSLSLSSSTSSTSSSSPSVSPSPLSQSPAASLLLSQSALLPRPVTPPSSSSSSPSSSSSSFNQLQIPPSILMQMKQKQANQDATPASPSSTLPSPLSSSSSHSPRNQLYQQLQSFLPQAKPTKLSSSLSSVPSLPLPSSSFSSTPSLSSAAAASSSGTLSPPTMPKGYSNAAVPLPSLPASLASSLPPSLLHAQQKQAQQQLQQLQQQLQHQQLQQQQQQLQQHHQQQQHEERSSIIPSPASSSSSLPSPSPSPSPSPLVPFHRPITTPAM